MDGATGYGLHEGRELSRWINQRPDRRPIKEGASAGNNIGLESMEVGLRTDKSKQPIEVQNPNNFSNRQVQHVNSVYSHRPQST